MNDSNDSAVNKPDDSNKPLQLLFTILLVLSSMLLCYEGVQHIKKAHNIHDAYIDFLSKNIKEANVASMVKLETVKEAYDLALKYFVSAAGVLVLAAVLPRLQEFSITPTGITGKLNQMQHELAEIKAKTILNEERLKGLK